MIRVATPDDIPAITAIINHLIRDTSITFNSVEKPESEVLAMMTDRRALGYEMFVADAGGVVGYATYTQFRAGVGYARSMEHSVALIAAGQGRGLGAGLMQAVEDHARAFGAHLMVGAITSENLKSVSFHKALGYVLVGTMPEAGFKFGKYYDLLLMQKILS
jgi:L-amino acid N-acyltransferase